MKIQDISKRRYNAAYRLRKKLGADVFPKRNRIILAESEEQLMQIPEVKILLAEFSYAIVLKLFT